MIMWIIIGSLIYIVIAFIVGFLIFHSNPPK